MADKAISELTPAERVTPADLFVLEQSGAAKKLTGQVLENWLVSFADGHGGIQSIVKKSTSGLKDTYRITLADTTTFDFIVTNGKAISSVKQTSVSGLTRTYTIAFNDGTSQTFTVTDGRSITDITKTKTNVLTDTYTISFNDGTSSTFTVKNGKGIESFAKVSTVDLVDTYRITYNDGTSVDFTVTNGAKGDKGDNTYTHIKFASQEPTDTSHSMGDVPDKWIGFYWGSSSTAPTDWKQYKWYQFKGDKGNTGAPATLNSFKVDYQVSDSGTIIPSGPWSASVPVVAQGKYLWTRTTNTFNTGSPVVSYSVSRMGLDGTGSVSSVAGISPDSTGNVPLTAADVNALSNMGGNLLGELKMNGQTISGLNNPTANDHAANMGFVNERVRKATPRNLLDNSYWENLSAVVNQRGATSYGSVGYAIDRWFVGNDNGSLTLENGGIRFKAKADGSKLFAYQFIEPGVITEGKKYTFALCLYDGTIALMSATAKNTMSEIVCYFNGGNVRIGYNSDKSAYFVALSTAIAAGFKAKWIGLYEGEYTEDTLPEYRPKGYGEELAECQRYYLPLVAECVLNGYFAATGDTAWVTIPTPVTMRVKPTIVNKNNGNIGVRSVTGAKSFNGDALTFATAFLINNSVVITIAMEGASFNPGTPCSIYFGNTVDLCADL